MFDTNTTTWDRLGEHHDLIVFFLPQDWKKATKITALDTYIATARSAGDFTGKAGQVLMVYPGQLGIDVEAARIAVIGLGKMENGLEDLRVAGGHAAKTAQKVRAAKLCLVLPASLLPAAAAAQALAEGAVLGAYAFERYKTRLEEEERSMPLASLTMITDKDSNEVGEGVNRGLIAAAAACHARDMAHEPGNVWTPEAFAQAGRDLAAGLDLECRVYGEPMLKRLGMGGILAVNRGTAQPPRLVILKYRCGRKKAPTVLLVGKGLTFDSGGISLKPSAGMEEMKYDMCGGAAVLAAMEAVGKERPAGVDVTALIPATDNLPGPNALKPGDIITHYNGLTSEIISTDAEGRLILGDALAYGVKTFKPQAVIDLATLTGAVIIGLGHHRAGLMSNNDELAARVTAAGDRAGEPVWRLPLGKEYEKQIESKVADLKNVGGREAGTITAGCYLQSFVGDTPWAHIDIAGTAWSFTEKSYVPAKGPSGFGVRLLVELLRSYA